ncbi:uncharacterized protein GGS22DRAFT_65844 [Annulohypoxylon maeteangense]|uniref:uncharacterized protein n=1 Tax=Annulohypoxylon maeteangense TaxID=1927788 RepID=UPI00200852E1|nr:uncharacterized protein GGS22DRAFT_65844 [Annulohypoxylon maeteangense]KAI0888993.1 hypothetical protein GGS22DRAFT_65844 [Annulohypoxylon maeteangense]
MPTPQPDIEENQPSSSCRDALSFSNLRRPVQVGDTSPSNVFWIWPFLGPLLVVNESSDTRDHCANERTFLSYLRLSIYMAVVAIAIVSSFHLKSQPSDLELRMARPLGIIFWLLSLACLVLGFGNYIKTLDKYSRKVAIVQTGWRTQSIMSLIALSIVSTCVILLVIEKLRDES